MQRFTESSFAIAAVVLLVVCGCRQVQDASNDSTQNEKNPVASTAEPSTTEPTATVGSTTTPVDNTESSVPETTRTVAKSTPSSASNQGDSQAAAETPNVQERIEQSSQPATVAQAVKPLDFSQFPKPRGSRNSFVFQSSLHFETKSDLNTTLVSVTDELLQRGFVERDSARTRMATVTIKIDDLPMTIFLTNSLGGNLTHVTMHHHQGIDISEVPQLTANGPIDRRVDQVYYQSEIGVREGHHILRTEIQKKNIPIDRMSTSNGIAKIFEKDGMNFIAHVEEAEHMEFETPESGNRNTTRVSIFNRGNVDLSTLPRPAEFEQTRQAYSSIFGSAKYFSKASALESAKQAAEELMKAGWKPVDSIREGFSDVQKLLINNGMLVQIRATEFGPQRSHVDYSLSLLPMDIPRDVETRMIRVDSAAPHMFYSTNADVTTLREFYRGHLEHVGWKPDESGQISNSEKFAQLHYGNYHQPVVLEIQNKGPQSTWVEIRPVDLDAIARIFRKEQVRPQEVEEEMAANQAETTRTPETAADVASALNEIEVPTSPEQIEALARKQMEEALKNVPAEHAAEIKKMMEQQLSGLFDEQGSEPGDSSEEMDETFASADESSDDVADQAAAPAVPEGKLAAEDFPIPDGAQNVTRDFEMITFGVKEVEKNAKFLTEKLTQLDWKTRGEQLIESDLAMLRFQKGVGTINISLTVDDRRDPPVHVVAHGDGIWFPESEMYGDDLADEGEMEGGEFGDDPAFDEFEVKDFEGLSLPKGIDSPMTMRSQFRNELVTSVEGELKTIHDFFRNAASSTDWKIQSEKLNKEDAIIQMANDRGELFVELKKFEGEIEINLAFRDPKVAKEHGFVPPAGQARLFLANMAEAEVTIVINGKSHKLAPEQGADDPKDSVRVDVAPGEYQYSIQGTGRDEQTDKVKVVAGGSWGIIVFPEQGHMAERMY